MLACSEELLGMHDMEAMVDLLRFGVPQWRHERLQVCRNAYMLALLNRLISSTV